MEKDQKVYRVLDANANRAREGLRVVEEYLRLVCDDSSFSAQIKALRHAITESMVAMDIEKELLVARESDTDVGATDPKGTESARDGMLHIVTANLRRSQEALRVLEEYSKLVSTEACARFKRLRFESYALEKEIALAGRAN
jgi:thiamine-phosphate pyrophosphorylase